jgi:uncharacterized membrane protein
MGGGYVEDSSFERLNLKDIMQVVVGSFVGALVFITSSEITRISDPIPFQNLFLIVAVSIFFSYAISYLIGVRRLGFKKMRMFLGVVPQRTLLQYGSSVFFSLAIFYLLGINNLSTSPMLVAKRTLVVAMPSTITASAADLLESQKDNMV